MGLFGPIICYDDIFMIILFLRFCDIFNRERGAMGGGVVKVRILYDFIRCD